MAKKKSKKGRKRRRIGAALNPRSMIVRLGSLGVGYFLTADPINTQIDKINKGKMSEKVVGGGTMGIGAALMLYKNPGLIRTVAGGIVAGAGLKRELVAFGVVTPKAIAPAVTGYRRMNGYGSVPVVGGYGSVPVVGGYTPAGTLGGYNPSGTLGVVGGVGGGIGGSGLMR